MRKIALFLVLMFAAVGRGKMIQPVNPMPRGVKASSMGFKNTVFVDPCDSLQTKLDWLESSDRDATMGALSSTNWRTLYLTPGLHNEETDRVILDTNYIAIKGLGGGAEDTIVQGSTGGIVVMQTCNVVGFSNFYIYQTGTANGDCAFNINCASGDNGLSTYSYMKFDGGWTGTHASEGVYGTTDINGLWQNCTCGDNGWRLAASKILSATMYDCIAGDNSYGGDNTAVDVSGTFYRCKGGAYCFGGCTMAGTNCSGTFIECIAGIKSFSVGKTFSGKAYHCQAGDCSFGGTVTTGGVFSGYAEDCVTSKKGFGGGKNTAINSGEMVRCIMTEMPEAMYCTGAKIRDSHFIVTTTNKNCLFLNDSNSVIYNTDLIVVQGGTGIPIKATSAKNVVVAHCRMNNASTDADGLDPNVTNLVTGENVVDNDIK